LDEGLLWVLRSVLVGLILSAVWGVIEYSHGYDAGIRDNNRPERCANITVVSGIPDCSEEQMEALNYTLIGDERVVQAERERLAEKIREIVKEGDEDIGDENGAWDSTTKEELLSLVGELKGKK
jgi:hypothetical protein